MWLDHWAQAESERRTMLGKQLFGRKREATVRKI